MPAFQLSPNITVRSVASDAGISPFTQYHGTILLFWCRHFIFHTISRYDQSLRMLAFPLSHNITVRSCSFGAVISPSTLFQGSIHSLSQHLPHNDKFLRHIWIESLANNHPALLLVKRNCISIIFSSR
jgi:hypothetical protein